MRIGILGTGTLAAALGQAWASSGHELAVAGRSSAKTQDLAARLGHGVRALTPRQAVADRDAVLLAVSWQGAEDMLHSAGAGDGSLEGTALIDPTNAVEHGVGVVLTGPGEAMAQRIARLSPGAHVVKAFHMFPSDQWAKSRASDETLVTVAMCGDDPEALRLVGELVRDAGGAPTVLGSLDRARQLEEVAGFVIGLAFAGTDPSSAIPRVPSKAA
ncbi:NADPH-dependent F420 reductase [Nonomuraea zeae]|uniref:NADP oxidoreductase n=1 Tax=Nonomuraea zeae TaxID=1642303 RepID=A0A5S4GW17_9ACTN|nr:NAD(P)-binding domain-containing protein [Nonomuraea zeae]TMR36959.1 NADP oxidoreductase [Nonomuraea zeae]